MTAHRGEPAPMDPAEAVWRAMRDLVHDGPERKDCCAALDLSFLRVKALGRLSHGPRTLRDLAGGLAVDPPYATVIVDDLERRGLVARAPHATDRRAKVVSLTAAGRKAASKADKMLNRPPDALRALPAETLAVLAEVMAGLTAAKDAGAHESVTTTAAAGTPDLVGWAGWKATADSTV